MMRDPIEPVSSDGYPVVAVRDELPRPGAPKPRGSARSVLGGAAAGVAAGIAATAVMSAFMVGAQKLGVLGRMPPRKISDALLGALGVRRKTPEPLRRVFATVNHFAFGATCGALFGAGARLARGRAAADVPITTLAGVGFGTLVWATSYMGWVPALGIMPRPSNDRFGRPTTMVLAHWIYGGALGALVARRG